MRIRRWPPVSPSPAARSIWRCCRKLWSAWGVLPLANYGLPGTPARTDGMLPYIPKYDAILLGNHGSVSYGEDVYKAFFRMELVKHFVRVTLVAELSGELFSICNSSSRRSPRTAPVKDHSIVERLGGASVGNNACPEATPLGSAKARRRRPEYRRNVRALAPIWAVHTGNSREIYWLESDSFGFQCCTTILG